MYDFDFGLGEDVDMLRESVSAFAAERIAPRAQDIDRNNQFPRDLWPELGDMGLLGITVAEQYGGSGLGYLSHVVAMEEISRASASVGLSYGAQSNLCINQLHRWGSEDQKQKYLPALISGEHVGALAMSEAGAGSDVMGMRTRAVLDGDDYVLNGNKMWITNAPEADVTILYAVTSNDDKRPKLSAFIIERDVVGFSAAQKLDKLGMRGSDTSEIVLQDCRVSAANLLGKEGQGAAILMSGLDFERLVLAAGPLGIMRACFDLVMPYVHDRKQFGQAIGTFQLMQGKIADMYTALNTARAYVYAVAGACDRGQVTRQDSAACVLYASEKAMEQSVQAVQAMGGAGYMNDSPLARIMRDAKLMEIGAGTSEIRRMLVGRELMKATA
jgi:isovaleryl-CoA dehydrogenase